MPELPEVETVRRGLEPVMTGMRLERVDVHRKNLRFPFPTNFSKRLKGQTVKTMNRRAKYLLAELSSGEALVMHLGMSGQFLIHLPNEGGDDASWRAGTHDHVVFWLSNGARVVYRDPRRFGFMDLVPSAEIENSQHIARLGDEPLDGNLTGKRLLQLFDGKRAPLKAALLDQRLIAGLGNIYVCEALFRAGLHPETEAGGLSRPGLRKKADVLSRAIRDVLTEAIAAGGSTLKDYVQTDGSLGYFQHAFRVYGREEEPCLAPGCTGTVRRIVQSGRSTFFCPNCQPPDKQKAHETIRIQAGAG